MKDKKLEIAFVVVKFSFCKVLLLMTDCKCIVMILFFTITVLHYYSLSLANNANNARKEMNFLGMSSLNLDHFD